ncbi:hypothetical protein [Pedobacter montanisoli]|uniref:Uncharacterized protein n=1 Tax=Pedobacter montanisoli TaxID=2923277 RepID=A0ABS9ZXX4_9SPHI|nr:hypothetical protein [Pedobacter montanisoli]MCJ0743161.1 hypothetical protein [Pedobacter montanisoli]
MFRISLALSFIILITIKQQCFAQKIVFNWGTQQADLNYNECYQSLIKLNLGTTKTKELADCIFGKLKSKFPKGVNLDTNQFIEIIKQLMKSCFYEQNVQDELPFFWNEQYLKGFRVAMLKSMPFEFSEDQKNKLFDCALKKLKEKYPNDGFKIAEIRKDFEKIAKDCELEIIK